MSQIDLEPEEEVVANPPVREIFSCISQVEGVVPNKSGEPSVSVLLWPTPQVFYDFLTKEVPLDTPETLWRFFRVNPEGIAQPAVYLMDEVFKLPYHMDSQPMILEELTSKNSWAIFQELSSGLEYFSMCYPLDLVIESLELLKALRIKGLQNKRDASTKRVAGLAEYAKRSKIQKEIEAGRDPSLPYTTTQSRIMNTCK